MPARLRYELPNYAVDVVHTPGAQRLVLLFPPMSVRPHDPGTSWGEAFVVAQGMSSLSVMPRKDDWYRGSDLHDWFTQPPFLGILSRYAQHTFYGISMGGYAACAFSALSPGSTVLAYSPQSTLANHLVPWERRYTVGAAQDWSGPWADGAPAILTAQRATIVFDPFEPDDARHVARLLGPKTTAVRAPFLGHHLASRLRPFRTLKSLFSLAHTPNASPSDFAALMRVRRLDPIYLARLSAHARTPIATAIATISRARSVAPDNDVVALAYASILMRCGDLMHGLTVAEGIRQRNAPASRLHVDATYLTARFQVALHDKGAAILTLSNLLGGRIHRRAQRLLLQLQKQVP